MVKAIETIYDGYRFRSRLEARWAVFFNHADIPYEYEVEGYVTESGEWYLPDFFLPDCGLYVEVKGSTDQIDFDWCLQRAKALPTPANTRGESFGGLMLVGNLPNMARIRHTPGFNKQVEVDVFWPVIEPEGFIELAGFGKYAKNRRPWWSGRGLVETSFPLGSFDVIEETQNDRVFNAYMAARQARFEHGESPRI